MSISVFITNVHGKFYGKVEYPIEAPRPEHSSKRSELESLVCWFLVTTEDSGKLLNLSSSCFPHTNMGIIIISTFLGFDED